MAAVILVLGAVLVGCGLVALWSGIAYMPVEWGWSQIIAGTTASTGGLVIVALAAVVHRLRAVETAMLRTAQAEAAALAPDRAEADAAAGFQATESTGFGAEPAPAPAGRSAPADPPSILVTPLPEQVQPRDAQETSDVGHRVGIGDVTALVEPDLEDASATPVRTPVLAAGDAVVHELADGVATTHDGERHVVGRYESGGASYALFSDGTIEVESETGTHRFGSMDELKAHVERQTRAPHAEDWPD